MFTRCNVTQIGPRAHSSGSGKATANLPLAIPCVLSAAEHERSPGKIDNLGDEVYFAGACKTPYGAKPDDENAGQGVVRKNGPRRVHGFAIRTRRASKA